LPWRWRAGRRIGMGNINYCETEKTVEKPVDDKYDPRYSSRCKHGQTRSQEATFLPLHPSITQQTTRGI
jgi:hypothetical protein